MKISSRDFINTYLNINDFNLIIYHLNQSKFDFWYHIIFYFCNNHLLCSCFHHICEILLSFSSVQFSHAVMSNSVTPMNRSTPGLPVHQQLPESTQTHLHWVGDAIQPSHPLSSPSPPALNLSQHQGLFQLVSSSHQVAKVLELQLQHQSFQWIVRFDFL